MMAREGARRPAWVARFLTAFFAFKGKTPNFPVFGGFRDARAARGR